jgi:hypothetical protein
MALFIIALAYIALKIYAEYYWKGGKDIIQRSNSSFNPDNYRGDQRS